MEFFRFSPFKSKEFLRFYMLFLRWTIGKFLIKKFDFLWRFLFLRFIVIILQSLFILFDRFSIWIIHLYTHNLLLFYCLYLFLLLLFLLTCFYQVTKFQEKSYTIECQQSNYYYWRYYLRQQHIYYCPKYWTKQTTWKDYHHYVERPLCLCFE